MILSKMTKDIFAKLIKVIIAGLLILGLSSFALAQGLNVVLSEQIPDPVSPGNFVYVNVKISNIGNTAISNANIRFVEDEVFSIAPGSDVVKNVGSIPASSGPSSAGNQGFTIAKFKLLVDEDAPLGLNTATFVVESTTGTYEYDFDILVLDQNPQLQVNRLEVPMAEAGSKAQLLIELENINTVALKDVFVTLMLDEVEGGVINVEGGSNQKAIPLIRSGENQTITYELIIAPDASSKPYLLPINISFEDTQDNSYSKEILGSVRVYSEPLVTVRLDSQEVYSEGSGRVTLAIANPGTSTIKGTQVEILSGDGYEILDGNYQYVGDLNPDDFQTVQSQIYLTSSESTSLQVRISYLDSYNNKNEEVVEIPLKTYSSNQLSQYGIGGGGSGGGGFFVYVIALILIIGAFIVGRKIGFKKGKAKRN